MVAGIDKGWEDDTGGRDGETSVDGVDVKLLSEIMGIAAND